MPRWILNLSTYEGTTVASHPQPVSRATKCAVFIYGDPNQPMSWSFTDFFDKTQPGREGVCHFEFEGGALKFSTELDDTFIRSLPLHPLLDHRIKIPYTYNNDHYFTLLRTQDTVEFDDHSMRIEVVFDPNSLDPDVEVESSGLAAAHDSKVKHEPSSDAETNDDEPARVPDKQRRGTEAEGSQHLYSTSREHQSPTPRPRTGDSQVVKDTPKHRRVKPQHDSYVPESIERTQPLDTEDPSLVLPGRFNTSGSRQSPLFNELPDIATGDLPNTSPSTRFEFPIPSDSETRSMHAGKSFGEDVEVLCHNLYATNSVSQAPVNNQIPEEPAPMEALASNIRFTPDAVPEDSHESSNTLTQAADAPHPTTPNFADVTEKDSTENHFVMSETPRLTSDSRKRPERSTSSKRKREKAQDVEFSASRNPAKRAKIKDNVDQDDHDAVTPASTTSKRTSSRRRSIDQEMPPSTISTRRSSQRKSFDDDAPPSTITRRISTRRKSVESQSASPSSSTVEGPRYSGPPPRILFSNTKVIERHALMKFLKEHDAVPSEIMTAKGSNFLCVGSGELLKTPKLLHSLTLGKTIVTDEWVSKSAKAGFLLDPGNFLPDELKGTMDQDREQIFADQVIYVTPALRKAYKRGWDDVMAIVRQAGGMNPLTGPLSRHDESSITLYVGTEQDDQVAAEIQASGHTVYKKDIFGSSIVHGSLLDDEDTVLPLAEVVPKMDVQQPKSTKKGRRARKA